LGSGVVLDYVTTEFKCRFGGTKEEEKFKCRVGNGGIGKG